jgi:hypothetical protein
VLTIMPYEGWRFNVFHCISTTHVRVSRNGREQNDNKLLKRFRDKGKKDTISLMISRIFRVLLTTIKITVKFNALKGYYNFNKALRTLNTVYKVPLLQCCSQNEFTSFRKSEREALSFKVTKFSVVSRVEMISNCMAYQTPVYDTGNIKLRTVVLFS